jgi:hypothetical protein
LLNIIKEVLSTAQAKPGEQLEQNQIEETVETEQPSPDAVTSAENFLSIRQGSGARDIRGKRPKLPRPW